MSICPSKNGPLDEFEINVLREFCAEEWSSFSAKCEELGIDPDQIYRKLGGEADS